MESKELIDLLRQIDAAFGNLRIPAESDLIIDEAEDDPEHQEIREIFKQRHWRDLTADDLEGQADSLAFLTPAAFQFFLPAFIRISLLEPERADLIPDIILWSFAPPVDAQAWEDPDGSLLNAALARGLPRELASMPTPENAAIASSVAAERCEIMTTSQKHAILAFFSLLRKDRPGEFDLADLDRAENALN